MLSQQNGKKLDKFYKMPVLSKNDIIKYQKKLQVQSSYHRKSIRKTSGSSGTPLSIEKDRGTTSFMDAAMYRSYSWHGIKPGDRQLRIWGSEVGVISKVKERIKDTLLNRIRISAFNIEYEKILRASIKIIKFKPRFVYGYAQSVYEVANILLDKKIDLSTLKFKAVVITGEMLYAWQKEIIRKAFNCPVVNEYGCTEAGIIAVECEFGKMHIIADGLFVEIIADDNVRNTEEGDVVITELNNMYSPLIRYRIGDRAVLSKETCMCGRSFPIIKKVIGRSDEFIVFPNGRKVDPYVVEYILKEIPSRYGKFFQFIIIQESHTRLRIKVVGKVGKKNKLAKYIERKWVSMYGNDIQLFVEIVKRLNRNMSGKLSCFKSNLHLQ